MKRYELSGACMAVLLGTLSTNADVFRVRTDGSGSPCGATWTYACTLTAALEQSNSGDEVWVAAGTYYGTFDLVNGVHVIGGFEGVETETIKSQSDPKAHVTVLDGLGTAVVVRSSNHAASTMLRGFRITNGLNDAEPGDGTGGGGAWVQDSSAMFVQCVFDYNTSKSFGGAAYVRGSGSPEFINCEFRYNGGFDGAPRTPVAGGAVYIHSGEPRFTNCLFAGNSASEAGAIAVDSGTPELINCTITGNTAGVGYGGGIYDPSGLALVKNSISWNNVSTRGNKEIENYRGKFTKVTKSNVEGGFIGTGNISANPLFAQGYRLQQASPCKNAGLSSELPKDVADLDWNGNTTTQRIPYDLNGNPRRVDFVVDMGAFETPVDPGPQ